MLIVDLQGPFSALPEEASNSLLTTPDARQAGLFIWTIEHNRAHRIHFVGTSADSIAKENLSLFSEILLGERAIYDPQEIANGSLEVLADSSSNTEQRCGAAKSAIAQLRLLNIFFAPTLRSPEVDRLVCDGIIRKLLNFGEIPTAWLEHSLRQESQAPVNQGLTVRFQRPAFIASLPDEMYL